MGSGGFGVEFLSRSCFWVDVESFDLDVYSCSYSLF